MIVEHLLVGFEFVESDSAFVCAIGMAIEAILFEKRTNIVTELEPGRFFNPDGGESRAEDERTRRPEKQIRTVRHFISGYRLSRCNYSVPALNAGFKYGFKGNCR